MYTYLFTAHVSEFDFEDDELFDSIISEDLLLIPAVTDNQYRLAVQVRARNSDDALARFARAMNSVHGVTIKHIDPDLVSLSEISNRTDVSRESVRLWATAKRRKDFPHAYTSVNDMRLWRWVDVFNWLGQNNIAVEDVYQDRPISAAALDHFNARMTPRSLPDVRTYTKQSPAPILIAQYLRGSVENNRGRFNSAEASRQWSMAKAEIVHLSDFQNAPA